MEGKRTYRLARGISFLRQALSCIEFEGGGFICGEVCVLSTTMKLDTDSRL